MNLAEVLNRVGIVRIHQHVQKLKGTEIGTDAYAPDASAAANIAKSLLPK